MRRCPGPDELCLSSRSSGVDDSDLYSGFAAPAASPGARGPVAAGPVFHSGGSGCAYVLRAERTAAKDSARNRDGLVPADWNDLRVGCGSSPCLEGFAAVVSFVERPAAAGSLH